MKKFDPIANPPIPASDIDWPFKTDSRPGVTAIGEDGEDWIVEGHMDPAAAFELLREYAASIYDESTAEDMFGEVGCYEVGNLEAGYGVFTEHADWCCLVLGEDEDDEDVPSCNCGEFGWFVTWGKTTAETPGAVPIMVLEA